MTYKYHYRCARAGELRRKTFLAIPFLILSWSVMPILGLQSSSLNIRSEGTIMYPEGQLGVFDARPGAPVPEEASWVTVYTPTYQRPREDLSVILNYHTLHNPYNPSFNPFVTEADLKTVEQGLKTVPTENFWGIIFIAEEHYKTHVKFNDDVNTIWFGEVLLGYPLYLAESPGATVNQWKDEMWLRMIRGFHNYFSPLTKVGITASGSSIVPNWKNRSWCKGIGKYWGDPAMTFIREHYDFVILYAYTDNLEDFTSWTSQYLQLVDQLFQKQKKLWILTRIFGAGNENWEREAIALEVKNCLDRNIVITTSDGVFPHLKNFGL